MPKENIHVIIRFRPTNKREKLEQKNGKLPKNRPLNYKNDEERGIGIINICSKKSRDPKNFTFDRILGLDDTQEEVFRVVAQRVCDDVLDGFNGTIFAYGQTGSGKTYTMFGPETSANDLNPIQMGIIPRAVSYIFSEIEEDPEILEARIKVSFVEIYKEKLRDLLNPSSKNLRIRLQANGETWVSNLTETHVMTMLDVLQLLEIANSYRTKAETAMNHSSSRSHMLMSITVALRIGDGSVRIGKINFADLAGCEKVRKTGATGLRLQEAMKINLSLTLLGQVISALCANKKHVPYRDSKLTHVLKDSLGGNCKTTLIVNCTAHIFNREETINSLRFGSRCKLIQNQVNANRIYSNSELMNMVTRLKKQNTKLQLLITGDEVGDEDDDLLENKLFVGNKHKKQIEKLENKIAQQNDELQNMGIRNEDLNDLNTHLKHANMELEDKRHMIANSLEMAVETSKGYEKEIINFKIVQSKMEESVNLVSDENQRLLLSNKALNQLNEEIRAELTQTRVDRHKKTSKLSLALNKFKEESNDLMGTVINQKQKLEEMEEIIANQDKQLDRKLLELQNMRSQMIHKEQTINQHLKKYAQLEKEMYDAKSKIKEMEAESNRLLLSTKEVDLSKEDEIEHLKQTLEERTQNLTTMNFELSKKLTQRELIQHAYTGRSLHQFPITSDERHAIGNIDSDVRLSIKSSTTNNSNTSNRSNAALMNAYMPQQNKVIIPMLTINPPVVTFAHTSEHQYLSPQSDLADVLLKSASLNNTADVIKAEQTLFEKYNYLVQVETKRITERNFTWRSEMQEMKEDLSLVDKNTSDSNEDDNKNACPRASVKGYNIMSARARKKQQRYLAHQNDSYLVEERDRLTVELEEEEKEMARLNESELPADDDERLQCLLDRSTVKDNVYKLRNQISLLVKYLADGKTAKNVNNDVFRGHSKTDGTSRSSQIEKMSTFDLFVENMDAALAFKGSNPKNE